MPSADARRLCSSEPSEHVLARRVPHHDQHNPAAIGLNLQQRPWCVQMLIWGWRTRKSAGCASEATITRLICHPPNRHSDGLAGIIPVRSIILSVPVCLYPTLSFRFTLAFTLYTFSALLTILVSILLHFFRFRFPFFSDASWVCDCRILARRGGARRCTDARRQHWRMVGHRAMVSVSQYYCAIQHDCVRSRMADYGTG